MPIEQPVMDTNIQNSRSNSFFSVISFFMVQRYYRSARPALRFITLKCDFCQLFL
jgi:hypothetical protein